MQEILRKKDKRVPLFFVMFFFALIAIDAILVTIAVSTHRGVVTENAYQKGLEYNLTIAAAEQQDKLGWKGDISFSDPFLLYHLTDENNQPIKAAEVTAYISRGTQSGYDFKVDLQYKNNGVYRRKVEFPMPGHWDIAIVTKWKEKHYQKTKRIIVNQ